MMIYYDSFLCLLEWRKYASPQISAIIAQSKKICIIDINITCLLVVGIPSTFILGTSFDDCNIFFDYPSDPGTEYFFY